VKELSIAESFVSVQGESSYTGCLCFFIRLSGCNLRCNYCDTTDAYEEGKKKGIEEIVVEAVESGCRLIEITGGEPLLQPEFTDLARELAGIEDSTVLVETNGSRDISVIPDAVVGIIDVKCPGSGEGSSFDIGNIGRLRRHDEMKFVLSNRSDYDWAKEFMAEHDLLDRCGCVHMSIVEGALEPSALSKWIVEDRLNVRMQVQLHKLLGIK
jgi:7-carboxy-7-deazaguanine synthase